MLVTDHLRAEVKRLAPVAEQLGYQNELQRIIRLIERGAEYQIMLGPKRDEPTIMWLKGRLITLIRHCCALLIPDTVSHPVRPYVQIP